MAVCKQRSSWNAIKLKIKLVVQRIKVPCAIKNRMNSKLTNCREKKSVG
jgi:hypothetical protein